MHLPQIVRGRMPGAQPQQTLHAARQPLGQRLPAFRAKWPILALVRGFQRGQHACDLLAEESSFAATILVKEHGTGLPSVVLADADFASDHAVARL